MLVFPLRAIHIIREESGFAVFIQRALEHYFVDSLGLSSRVGAGKALERPELSRATKYSYDGNV